MKKYSALLFVASLVLTILTANTATAADKKKKSKKPVEPTGSFIASVSGSAVAITTGTATKTLLISQFTEVKVNGQKATALDLKPGMRVTEMALGADPTVASRINAADAPVAEKGGR